MNNFYIIFLYIKKMGFNDYIPLIIVISYIFIIQGLVINSVFNLDIGENSKMYDTYHTLKIINFVGLAYAFLGTVIGMILIDKLKMDSYNVSAIIAILYLGITIANCVYVYKLPENDDNNTNCNFEGNSIALKIYCVASTVFTGLIGLGLLWIKIIPRIGDVASIELARQL